MIFHPDDAREFFAKKAGEKYRPSNGTEGEAFMSWFCFKCERDKDEDCEILARTFAFDTDDPRYPCEWQYGPDGQPRCTAFCPRGEKLPTPRCDRTQDMFSALERDR